MYIGVSFISIDQARVNLIDQLSTCTTTKSAVVMNNNNNNNNMNNNNNSVFDCVRAACQTQWDEVLSLITIEDSGGATESNKTLFCSNLYHTFLAPTTFSESNVRLFHFLSYNLSYSLTLLLLFYSLTLLLLSLVLLSFFSCSIH